MVSFENFVKSLPPSLSELKVKPIFCFPIKIRDDPTASTMYSVLFQPEMAPNVHLVYKVLLTLDMIGKKLVKQ